jgi:hypothetical protein
MLILFSFSYPIGFPAAHRHSRRALRTICTSLFFIRQAEAYGVLREFLEAADLRSEHWQGGTEAAAFEPTRSILAKRNEA